MIIMRISSSSSYCFWFFSFRLAEKLEIWTSQESNGTNSTDFNYLGYITLSDNASTIYKSRELKSVALPETDAVTLKLKLHKPHKNAHNVHEQVLNTAIIVYINFQNDYQVLKYILIRKKKLLFN